MGRFDQVLKALQSVLGSLVTLRSVLGCVGSLGALRLALVSPLHLRHLPGLKHNPSPLSMISELFDLKRSHPHRRLYHRPKLNRSLRSHLHLCHRPKLIRSLRPRHCY